MFAGPKLTGVHVRIAALLGMVVTLSACAHIDRWLSRSRAGEPATAPPVPEAPATTEPEPSPPPGPAGEATEVERMTICGQLGAPDCPLQAWMDGRLNTAFSTGDFPEVARSFRELAADPPEGFITWGSWAEQGAEAADRHDEAGVRQVCLGCHEDTRDTYRKTMRDRPVRAVLSETQ